MSDSIKSLLCFWLRSKCRICYQLNIWYDPHVGTTILNWFLDHGQKWKSQWVLSNRLLKQVRDTPGPWHKVYLPRREEVIINRLRTGHTWITHNYLMSGRLEHLPICPICNLTILTVPHFLINCPDLRQARITNFRTLYSRNISITEPYKTDLRGWAHMWWNSEMFNNTSVIRWHLSEFFRVLNMPTCLKLWFLLWWKEYNTLLCLPLLSF